MGKGGESCRIQNHRNRVSSKLVWTEGIAKSPVVSSKTVKERRNLEKGGAKASILMEDCSHAVPAVPFSKPEDAREIEPDDHGLVLPCAPPDEEKVRGEVRESRTNSQTAALGTCPFFLSTSIRTFGRFLVFVTFNTRRLLYMPPSCVRHVVCTAKNVKKNNPLIVFLHRSGLLPYKPACSTG